MGDLKIHDMSFLPDPCPLPEQIKKRALIEKERLIYAPFSGVGGIVYDKDAVYVELGTSHSHNKQDSNDDNDNMVSNLIETKETLEVKIQHSEIQIFPDGKAIAVQDVCSNSNEEEDTNKQLYSKSGAKEQSVLEDELKALREKDFSKLSEEKVQHSGRTRRRVIFNTDDEELSKSFSEDDCSDNEKDTEVKPTTSNYTTLKENKDSEVQTKISSVLKQLENKEKYPADENTSDEDDEESNASDKDDDESKVKQPIDEDSSSYDEMDEESDDENEDLNQEAVSEDEQSDEESEKSEESDNDSEDDMGIKWKENLVKKAEDAFIARQSSSKNLMKLVYGEFTIIILF